MEWNGKSERVIIGCGVLAGLADAKRLVDAGYQVELLEQRPIIGGMVSSGRGAEGDGAPCSFTRDGACLTFLQQRRDVLGPRAILRRADPAGAFRVRRGGGELGILDRRGDDGFDQRLPVGGQ